MEKLSHFSRAFFRSNVWSILTLLVIEVAGNFFTLLVALVAAQVCAQAIGYNSVRGKWLIAMGFPSAANAMLYVLGGIIIIRAILEFFRRWKRGRITEKLLFELRCLIFEHHIDMEGQQYKERNSSRYLLRFSGDLSSIQGLISRGILALAGDCILILLSIAAIAYLHPPTAIMILVLLLLSLLVVAVLNRKIGHVEVERRNRKSGLLSYVSQHFRGIITIKALNQRTPVLNQYTRRAKKLQNIGNHYHRLAALLHASAPFGVYLILWVVLFSMNSAYFGNVEANYLLAIVLILLSWRSVLLRLFKIGLVWKKGLISWSKLGILLERPTENWESADDDMRYPNAGLSMEAVTHEEDGHLLLPPQNISVEKGAHTYVEVANARHKRIIIELLAAIYLPSQGTISIGDIPLGKYGLKAWRKRIGFVSNVFPLRGRTVMESVIYSNRQKHKQDAQAIWQDWQARFSELELLELDTRIDGEGQKLTHTQEVLLQWLRLCLAKKNIWVVDQNYTTLPPKVQQTLDDCLDSFKKKRTILYINEGSFED